MPRLASLVAFMLFTISAVSQSFPEVEAVIEAFLAKDAKTVLKHLPSCLQESFSQLPQREQAEIGRHLLVAESFRHQGGQATRSDDPAALVVVDMGAGEMQEVVLDKRISDGYESVLWLALRNRTSGSSSGEIFQISLRHADGEWRIYELRDPDSRRVINLDDPELIERLHSSELRANESSAIGTLRSYVTACITYAASYPGIGYPPSLDVLGGNGDEDSTPDHSGLVDITLSSPPYENSGYRFGYSQTTANEYTIVARPLEYGTSGRRSFYTDQTGVIRFTQEDRDAEATDAALE